MQWRFLLPMTLLAGVAALKVNHTFEHDAAEPLRWAKCLADKNPAWLLLAGDSNWRAVYYYIKEKFESRANLKPVVESCMEEAGYQPEGCDGQWGDRDTLYSVDGKMVRLSLRFVTCGEEVVQRLGDSLAKINQCACRKHPYQFTQGWDKPYGMIYTHGLWRMPEEAHVPDSCAEVKERCGVKTTSPRHEFLVRELAKFKHSVPYFRWATNFHIAYHPTIPLAQVQKDNECQREATARTAKKDRPVLFDVWKETEEAAGGSMHVGGFHLDEKATHHVASRIFQQMGC